MLNVQQRHFLQPTTRWRSRGVGRTSGLAAGTNSGSIPELRGHLHSGTAGMCARRKKRPRCPEKWGAHSVTGISRNDLLSDTYRSRNPTPAVRTLRQSTSVRKYRFAIWRRTLYARERAALASGSEASSTLNSSRKTSPTSSSACSSCRFLLVISMTKRTGQFWFVSRKTLTRRVHFLAD